MTCTGYAHHWTKWSDRFVISDYYAQQRVCTCCGYIEIREIKIK